MAPLFIDCSRLSYVYSPYTSRKRCALPGLQARVVPYNRQSRNISRANFVVKAISKDVVERNQDHRAYSGNGARESGEQPSQGLLAVHGGERAGRPRVSGEAPKHAIYSAYFIGHRALHTANL